MAPLPRQLNLIETKIDEAVESTQEPPRPHLGCSLLGHKCDRWIWLSFRWAVIETFSGRMLRLFQRGQDEENRIVRWLEMAGMKLSKTGDDQMKLSFGFHIKGSPDGVIDYGVPQAPTKPHLVEFKTHALKSFDAIVKDGVEKSKPMHYAQMQLYMHGAGLDRCVYVAVCKNDDRLYTERVRYNKKTAEALLERGKRLALAERIPDPISTDPSWYECKFCPAYDLCHQGGWTTEVNCRTCAHATAEPDGTWSCVRHEAGDIPVDFQRVGCEDHVLHPDLVPWQRHPSDDPHEAVYEINGAKVRNGHADAYVFSSAELVTNPDACTDPLVGKVRETFPGAKVVNDAS